MAMDPGFGMDSLFRGHDPVNEWKSFRLNVDTAFNHDVKPAAAPLYRSRISCNRTWQRMNTQGSEGYDIEKRNTSTHSFVEEY